MNARDFDLSVCEAAYDEMANHADFVARRAEHYKQQCEKNCLDAVYETDENKIMASIILIFNAALKAERGDSDEKFACVDLVNAIANKLIADYAEEKAELDWQRRND